MPQTKRFFRAPGPVLSACLLLLAFLALAATAAGHATAAPPVQVDSDCGPPVIVVTEDITINLRGGPGIDYEAVGQIAGGQSLPVIGRAGFARWWVVLQANGTAGWASADFVTVVGYIDDLPIIEPPPLASGDTPAPGPAWNPVGPDCPPTPTPFPTPDLTATAAVAGADFVAANWADPLNLSRSGAATSPRIFADSSGQVHALWLDTVAGYVYSRLEGSSWTLPVAVELPFGTRRYSPELRPESPTPYYRPRLIADGAGRIHAFWLDNRDALYTSSAPADDLANFLAWTPPQQLANAVLDLAVAQDPGGRLHLAYVRPLETSDAPAGVYYRQTTNENNINWDAPALLDRSAYFRTQRPEDTRIDIVINVTGVILIAWDNPALERVYTIRSTDAGLTWAEVQVVDQRLAGDSPETPGPRRIMAIAAGTEVHLIWQASHEGDTCTHYHQWSADGGAVWQPAQTIEPLRSCSTTTQLFAAGDGTLRLLSEAQDTPVLGAWNGVQWSEFLPQLALTSFVNQETLRPLTFSCQQYRLFSGDRLFVVGCDQISNDVWVTQRPVGDVTDWFPEAPVWNPPLVIGQSPEPVNNVELVADDGGLLHAFWDIASEASIYYSRFDGTRWLEPLPLLRTRGGLAVAPDVVFHPSGRLLAVWADNDRGLLFFSQVQAARAEVASEWTPARQIPLPAAGARSPRLALDESGDLYVAYVVPLNEGRGVYVLRSSDLGESWSTPIPVLDAETAGWEMIDTPRLAATGAGRIHLLITRYSLPGGSGPRSLHYLHSTNGGETWSEMEMVVSGAVLWSDVVAVNALEAHRNWQVDDGSRIALWHSVTIDGGTTWSRPDLLAGGDRANPVTMVLDSHRLLHQFQALPAGIQHWSWDGARWQTEASFQIDPDLPLQIKHLSGAVSGDRPLTIVFAAEFQDDAAAGESLFATSRVLADATAPLPPPPTPSPTPAPTATPEPTLAPRPTATLEFPTSFEDAGSTVPQVTSPALRLLLGIVPAMLFIAVIIAVIFSRRRRV